MQEQVVDSKGTVVSFTPLLKINIACSDCGKVAGSVYLDNDTNANTMEWQFICKRCQK